jgi:hypothetical protein
MSESQEQQKLIHWWDNYGFKPKNLASDCPELNWHKILFAVANGGLRNIREAAKLKREGVRKGVPDLMLSYPNKSYPGLYIEMKFGDGVLSKEQNEIKEMLTLVGYKVSVCYSFEEAKQVIEDYLDD